MITVTIKKANPCHDPQTGQFCSTGGGGKQPAPVAVGGGTVSAKNPKEFNKQADKLYKDSKSTDWEPDFDASLKMKGYFGTSQSFAVNNALRTRQKPIPPRLKEVSDNLKNGLEKHGVDIGNSTTKLFRAVNGPFASQLAGMKAGQSFTDEGWVSTAGTKDATKRFGKVMMEISPKKGSKLKALVFRPETEVLFPPGRKFTVGKIRQEGGKTVVSVEME